MMTGASDSTSRGLRKCSQFTLLRVIGDLDAARCATGRWQADTSLPEQRRKSDNIRRGLFLDWGLFSWQKWKRSTRIFKSSVRRRTPIFGRALNHRLVSAGVRAECLLRATKWPASEFASKRSGATQRPRREEHAAPPAGNPAVAVVGRRYRQKSLLTLS